MRRAVLLGVLALTSVLSACQSASDRRWAELEKPAADTTHAPAVSVYAFSSQDTKVPVTLRDFAERAQAKAVELIFAGSKSVPDALQMLARPLPAASEMAAEVDRTSFKRTLVVSLADPVAQLPGDRFWKADITLRPAESSLRKSFEFTGYTVALAEIKAIPIAKKVEKNDRGVSGEIAPKFGSGAASLLDVKANASKSEETTADIVQTYVPVFPDITPRLLTLHKRGERGADITGNTLISLSLRLNRSALTVRDNVMLGSQLKVLEKGIFVDKSLGSLSLQRLTLAPYCNLKAYLGGSYMAREIVHGREHYVEGKQKVRLRVADLEDRQIDLISAEDLSPPVYALVAENEGKEFVYAQLEGSSGPLVMDSPAEARTLAAWLRLNGSGAISLTYDGRPIAPGVRWIAKRYLERPPASETPAC